MVRLQKAHNHVNALADYAQHNKASADNERVQKTALKAAEQIDRYITSSRPHCPVITLPLRLRYTLGINLTSLGLNQRGCKQFQKVHAMAPGFVQVEKFLARCKIEKGNNAAAQKLLIQFLDHHPTRTDAYLTLAELDLPAATRHLARQVLERDALSHPERTAMLARMMIALDRWEDLRALLQLAREHADRETYREMGRHIAQFSQQRGKSDNLNKLRESFPNAFPAVSKDN